MTQAVLDRPTAAAIAAEPDRTFVTLSVADQLCGVPVLAVRDILGKQEITRVPLARAEIAGSLNLRGRIVTAIDLRRRLRLPPAPPNAPRMSVVVSDGSGELYALLVDAVAEVTSPPSSQFERNPPTLPANWRDYSTGIYRLADRLMVVLDVAQLLALSEHGV
jgi:purine-binding chemotaxis protein CheW